MAIGSARRNANDKFVRSYVRQRSHGCTFIVFGTIRGNCQFERWARLRSQTTVESILDIWMKLALFLRQNIYRATQWSQMCLCATIDWKNIFCISNSVCTMRHQTGFEWTILRKHGKNIFCNVIFWLIGWNFVPIHQHCLEESISVIKRKYT